MQQKKRPNILFITCDQLRYDFVHAYGKNDFIQTPHIDALAQNGCLFSNAYSPNPVCIPARHNIITGLGARHHGFDDNYFGSEATACPWQLPTFAQILSDAGYSTIAIGKMHFQPERRATGFDRFINCDEVVKDVQEDDYALYLRSQGYGDVGSMHGVRNILYMQPQQSILPEHMHESRWIVDQSIDYLNMRGDRQRPFLMWVGFIQPHPPFAVPPTKAHVYDGKVPPRTTSITPIPAIARESQLPANPMDEASIQRIRELYSCAVSYVDEQIGRLIEALREQGELESTLILFTSDHGEMLGDLDAYQKSMAYDASSKIPMIAYWPAGILPGCVRDEFVDLNDILPTFLDLAGADYPGNVCLPGESLFTQTPQKDRTLQYIEHQRGSKRWCCLREKRYKYIHYYGDDDQLFDLDEDPFEKRNLLFGDAGESVLSIRDRLRQNLVCYEEKYGLEGYVDNGDFRQYPRYQPVRRFEKNYPCSIKRIRGDTPDFRPLEEDIFEAIRDERTVHLSRLGIRESLTQYGGFTDERVDALLERARIEDRY
ncbi:MAG: sulfatase-like hydrolase/transferase [Christensenella sp.]|nr:sulfatase-like hydrolase/transferase [Christensenella sp.]